jgi:hypothetical protein
MYGRFQGPTPGKAGAIARGTGLRSAPFVRRGMAYRLVQISSMSDDPATALAVRADKMRIRQWGTIMYRLADIDFSNVLDISLRAV